MDMYGISNAVMEANSLHGQIALNEEVAQSNYKTALDKFHKTIKDAKSRDSSANDKEYAEDLPTLNSVYQTGAGIVGGLRTGVATGQAAVQQRIASQAAEAGNIGEEAGGALVSARDLNPAAITATGEAVQEASVGEQFAEGARTLGSALYEGGALVGTAAAGGARGFVKGAEMAGGIGTSAGGELTGLGGVVQSRLLKYGAGEEAASLAGKGVGAIGGIITAGQQIDSLIESGGKSAFTRVNAQGQRVAMSGVDKASEFLNEAGAVADVLAASTGGLLVPVAAALNVAGAVTGIIGEYKDEKADDKEIGLNPDGTTDASKAPKLSAPPATEAFTGLGFVGNMTHNPLEHIA